MKQKVKLLTNAACDRLLTFQTEEKLRAYYGADNFPKELLVELNFTTPWSIDDTLELSPKPEDDVESSIKIFEELKQLDRVQANDRRLWVGLTHGRFFEYTKARWVKEEYSDNAILRRFHFEGSSLEARMRNGISRLWWAAKITYDESREDPFELTRLLWEKQDIIQNIVERSYGTYENVVQQFLETYKRNKQLSEKELRIMYTGLNAIGGVKVLSALSKEEVDHELIRVAKYSGIRLH